MKYIIISLIIMFLAHFLPRAVPITLMNKKIESKFLKSFLFYVPYAVIASLTFPYVFYATGNIYISLIATVVAIGLSLLNVKMVLVALGSVTVIYLLLLLL